MRRLARTVVERFALDLEGIHGIRHWARVLENARRIAASNGANLHVLEVFALLHDSCRRDDGGDPEHGPRAAEFARDLFRDNELGLRGPEALLLFEACEGHSRGGGHQDITVCTCYDADRLDLGRIGIWPQKHRLSTREGKDPGTIDWALRRGLDNSAPDLIRTEWGLDLREIEP